VKSSGSKEANDTMAVLQRARLGRRRFLVRERRAGPPARRRFDRV